MTKVKAKVQKEEVVEQSPLNVSIDAVNNFINIIDVIMVNDPRGSSIITHLQNMLISQNPQLDPKNQQPE